MIVCWEQSAPIPYNPPFIRRNFGVRFQPEPATKRAGFLASGFTYRGSWRFGRCSALTICVGRALAFYCVPGLNHGLDGANNVQLGDASKLVFRIQFAETLFQLFKNPCPKFTAVCRHSLGSAAVELLQVIT